MCPNISPFIYLALRYNIYLDTSLNYKYIYFLSNFQAINPLGGYIGVFGVLVDESSRFLVEPSWTNDSWLWQL